VGSGDVGSVAGMRVRRAREQRGGTVAHGCGARAGEGRGCTEQQCFEWKAWGALRPSPPSMAQLLQADAADLAAQK
jgi:hypothetical protein